MKRASLAQSIPEFGKPELVLGEEEFLVRIDPGQTMGELLDRGNFGYWDPLAERFTLKICQGEKRESRLMSCCFNAATSGEMAYRLIRQAGFIPVTPVDLLAMAVEFPNEERENDLVALGSSEWRDHEGIWRVFTVCFNDPEEHFQFFSGAEFTETKKRVLCVSPIGAMFNADEHFLVYAK
jgi:hypothetical protein